MTQAGYGGGVRGMDGVVGKWKVKNGNSRREARRGGDRDELGEGMALWTSCLRRVRRDKLAVNLI